MPHLVIFPREKSTIENTAVIEQEFSQHLTRFNVLVKKTGFSRLFLWNYGQFDAVFKDFGVQTACSIAMLENAKRDDNSRSNFLGSSKSAHKFCHA